MSSIISSVTLHSCLFRVSLATRELTSHSEVPSNSQQASLKLSQESNATNGWTITCSEQKRLLTMQQVNKLQNQNAALGTRMRSQMTSAQKACRNCVERSRRFSAVHKHRRGDSLSVRKTWESHRSCQSKRNTSTCGPRKLRTTCQVLFRTCVELLAFAVWSHDEITAAAVAIGVLGLDGDPYAEIDGQLFTVLSGFTDDESFDTVTSAGFDRGFESWRRLHKRWDRTRRDVHAASSYERDPGTTASEVTRTDGPSKGW